MACYFGGFEFVRNFHAPSENKAALGLYEKKKVYPSRLFPLLLGLVGLAFIVPSALAAHLVAAPGTVFHTSSWVPGYGYIAESAPFSVVSPDGGGVPAAILNKTTAWTEAWIQKHINARNIDPVWGPIERWTYIGPTRCRVVDYDSTHEQIECLGDISVYRTYPGTPPYTYITQSGFNALGYWTTAPCPAGTEYTGPNPTDCRPVCPAGTTRDAATGECRGRCTVDPIPEYTPDPYPALIDELNPRMQTALTCLQAAIRGQGGSSIFKSGYRPAPYNAHLQAVFDQRAKLRGKGPECAARKAELAIEEQRHDIGTKRPGNNSLHSIREAFDLKSSLSLDVTNGLAIVCNAFAPYPITDRNHFEHTR